MDIHVAGFLIERKRFHSFLRAVDSKLKNNLMQGAPFQLLKLILEWDLATFVFCVHWAERGEKWKEIQNFMSFIQTVVFRNESYIRSVVFL